MRDLHPIRTWIFDLDNTLYPPETQLFAQIEVKMTEWVMRALGLGRAEADRLRRDYWLRYGTTLAGLMAEHGVDPAEYLDGVHDITLDDVVKAPALAALISALPGRRIVFTNGSGPYAARVLAALGLGEIFDAVYGVEHAGFRPKPERAAFDAILALDGSVAAGAAMFEDSARNLEAPHAMGMRCVLVGPEALVAPHIHHRTEDLERFLSLLAESRFPSTPPRLDSE